jgi:hypothetical protein
MPRIPVVDSPEAQPTPMNQARVTGTRRQAVLAPTIRANPGMRNAEFGALSGVGEAVADTGRLLFKVKNATDAAYITRSETQMQAAQADFQNWAKTNPDPSTWQPELDARMKEVKESVTTGAKGLSPFAKQRLGLVLNDFEVTTRKRVQLQATEQNLQIAQASYQEFISQAVANNDLQGIEAKVVEGVQNGIFSAKLGNTMLSKARQQITANMANALIESDPFEARRQLEAKDDSGNFLNFPELQPAARENLLLYRVAKAESIERAQATREWSRQIAEAREGKGPMPDVEGVQQEAARMGIAKKEVDRWFKPPTSQNPTNPEEFAATFGAISTYNPETDPTGQRMGELVAQIESFKGPARERLDGLLTKKLKPDDTLNQPVAKFGVSSIKDMFEIGGYGSFKDPPTYDQTTGERIAGKENPAAKQRAEVVMARNLDLFQDWIGKHPDATYQEAQKYINSLNTEHATNSASRLIINAGAFGFPAR